MKDFWNKRYRQPGWAYGTQPDAFFRTCLDELPPGKLLLPAEGEGRHAVYAASRGWQVWAFDQSTVARDKALRLARGKGVVINYQVGEVEHITYPVGYFDCLGLMYAHFAPGQKSACHRKLQAYLRPGGTVIFEAFAKAHYTLRQQNPAVGGPPDKEMLFAASELRQDFQGFAIALLEETEEPRQAGEYHRGRSAVVRMLARKAE